MSNLHIQSSATQSKDSIETNSNNLHVKIASFDFDGTCVDCNSPVLLVKELISRRMLPPSVILRIGLWAAAYKCRLPQDEAWVRGLVFRGFRAMTKQDVDAFLGSFYSRKVKPLIRPAAIEEMKKLKSQGIKIVIVSATFEPIITSFMKEYSIDYQISTKMKINDDNTYSCLVDGKPVEGEQKMVELQRFADDKWGSGNWSLHCAYGDHHSDRAMLAAAKYAFAVNPDRPLSRTAHRQHYQILNW